MRLHLTFALASAALLLGCGTSTPQASSTGTAGSTSTSAANGGSSGTASGSAASSSGTGGTSGSTGSASGTTGTTSGTGSTTGTSGTSGTAPQWTWVDVPGALCRDGTATGIGVSLSPASTRVVVFLEGGGACFNSFTCNNNPSHFDAADFAGLASGVQPGIFDRTNAANPLKDWSFVYVPYCTGDVHAGNQPNGQVPGVTGTQQFVGYQNVALDLQQIVPMFPNASQVLLTGVSAGGFGAAANYDQVSAAFGSVPVDLLDDSGPFMRDPYLASCLQDSFRQLWNLDATLLTDCGGDCPDTSDFMLDYGAHVVRTHASRKLGLLESTDDDTIRLFFGFGANACTSFAQESPAQFEAGLSDIRTTLANDANYGSYYFTSTDHTSLSSPSFYTRSAGGVALTTWVDQLVHGTVSTVGP